MNPVCCKCHTEMKCNKTGALVAPKDFPDHVYSGDLFSCKTCENTIITGFGAPSHRPNEVLDIRLQDA